MGVKIIKKRTSAANGWEFPLLCDCRAAWEKRYGPTVWDSNIRDWGDEEEEQPKARRGETEAQGKRRCAAG